MYKIIVKKESAFQMAILTAGFSALVVQVLFLRAFLNIFLGNELVSGVVLANWMVLTAAGAFAAARMRRPVKASLLIAGLILLAFLPAMSVGGLYGMKAVLFPPGMLPGFFASWLFSFLLMLPFCVISGALFAMFVKGYSYLIMKSAAGTVYALEASGALLAGLLFSLLLVRIFSTFEILMVVSAANIAAAMVFVLAWNKSRKLFHGLLITLLVWVVFNMLTGPDRLVHSWLHPGRRIVAMADTPFGSLLVTRSAEQLNFFENGLAVFSTGNTIQNEESVHYPLLQRPQTKNVLVVSGDIMGIRNELEKYQVGRIDYVEINPAMVDAQMALTGLLSGELLHVYREDPRHFIRTTPERFDAVLLNVPPPASLQLNRFYTLGFFNSLKQKLNPDAVISLRMEGGSNYLGNAAIRLYSSIVHTLRMVFNNVILVPGQSNYLLASDGSLSYNYVEELGALDFDNQYVNAYYLQDDLMNLKAKALMEQLNPAAPVNQDFKPVAYFDEIAYWLSWYGMKPGRIVWPVFGVFLLLLIFLGRADKGMFAAGFSASAVEVMALLAFQVFYGIMYQAMALLIAVFMGGLALGAWLLRKILHQHFTRWFLVNQAAIGGTGLLVPVVAFSFTAGPGGGLFAAGWLYGVMLLSGVLTGMHFSMAWQLKTTGHTSSAAVVYGFDLLGSAAGALLAVAVLIPVLGLLWTGIFLAGMNGITILLNGIATALRRS